MLMLRWKFVKLFRFQDVSESQTMIALWCPATNPLNSSSFPFPICSCLLLLSNPGSFLDLCRGTLWPHTLMISCSSQHFTQRWHAKYMEWVCRGISPWVGSVAIENTPEVCSACYWYCTVRALKLHLILRAQDKFSSACENCHFLCVWYSYLVCPETWELSMKP